MKTIKSFTILQLFTFLFLFLTKIRAADYGMIAYFAGSCPEGWESYEEGERKFVFGSGTGYEVL